jgi:uncharacterized membrane protein
MYFIFVDAIETFAMLLKYYREYGRKKFTKGVASDEVHNKRKKNSKTVTLTLYRVCRVQASENVMIVRMRHVVKSLPLFSIVIRKHCCRRGKATKNKK